MTKQYNIRELENNYERAVFLKGDEVYPRETTRYQWAAKHLLGENILEIGCSSGYGRQFLPAHIDYTGLDYDAKIIKVAKEQKWHNADFIHADINQIELGQYDTIIAFEVIEHLDNGLEIVEKLKKHCKRLLITVPWNEPKGYWGEHHKLHGLNESNFPLFKYEYINEKGFITNTPEPLSQHNPCNLMLAKWDNQPTVLCSVATRGRYFTTLPMVLMAIANQTKIPDRLVIFDDNDEPQDLRKESLYTHIFNLFDEKQLKWEVVFAPKKGQHHIHQMANSMGYDWVWRVDDDAIPEANVLEELYQLKWFGKVGAVGGSILTAPIRHVEGTGKIENIDNEPNLQWGYIDKCEIVEHLHCSFLYRAGVVDYPLGLSRVAHREETLFTYGLHKKGYDIVLVPDANTWHLKNPQGGIRQDSKQEMFEHDEKIYKNFMQFKDNTIVVLNCGMGDHLVFSSILSEIKNPIIFGCYPDIIPCRSIAEAQELFGDIDQWNIYKKMAQWGWKDSLQNAFRKLYL